MTDVWGLAESVHKVHQKTLPTLALEEEAIKVCETTRLPFPTWPQQEGRWCVRHFHKLFVSNMKYVHSPLSINTSTCYCFCILCQMWWILNKNVLSRVSLGRPKYLSTRLMALKTAVRFPIWQGFCEILVCMTNTRRINDVPISLDCALL